MSDEQPDLASSAGASPVLRQRPVIGPLITAAMGVVIELLSRTRFEIPNPGVLYLAAVVGSIYIGGMISGIVSAVLALALASIFFSIPGPLFTYTGEDLRNIVTLVIATPIVVALVGVLKRRDELRVRHSARAEALEQYRDMVEELDAIVLERDAESHRVRFISRRAEDVLGFPLDHWIESPDAWVAGIHPDDRERVLKLWREAAGRGAARVLEYRMIAADGRTVWLRDAARSVREPRGRERVRAVVMEITERKRAEEALRTSEAHKSAILQSALDAMIDIDREGRITEFNPAAEKMFGYRREDVLGREMAPLVIPHAFRERHRQGMRRHLETGQSLMIGRRMELTGMRSNGTEFPIELAVIEVPRDGASTFTGFVRDITQRKLVEEALRASEANYRMLMEKASDGILVTDFEATIADVNPRGCEILGYAREELVGTSFSRLVLEEDLERLPLRLEELRAGQPVMIERWLRRKDGELVAVEISAKRLDEERLQGIFRDVTERKHAEQGLRHAMSLLSATLDSTGDGILVVDMQGHITSFNRRFVEMWNIPADVVESRDDNRAIHYVLDQLREPRDFVRKVRELYAQPEAESFDLLEFKDGRVFERYSMPQRISGESVGRVWNFRDVTERRRAEQALRQSEEQLRQSQKMEAIGRLAGGVAHDFNNLLTAILGNSSLLLDQLVTDDPRRQPAAEIEKAAERAAALTRQLLAFSRSQMLELKVLELNTVVTDMHKMLERLIGEDIELILAPANELGRVRVDRGQMEQVILNLVLNARDAMPQGGKLILETANVEADASFLHRIPGLQPGRYVMLAVSDTGVGMDEETRAHMFEPFFTTKERGKGTGLGLSTVYGIVRQSGGHIWVYSQPGRGSTFKIYLPRVEAEAEEPVAVADDPPAGGGHEIVLLVEDEAVVRSLARNTLVQRGYRVLEAENGQQALEICDRAREPIHLLVTDVVMPGMSGRELAERLTKRRPDLHVLFISGYTDETIAHHGVLGPGVGFLQKPFTLAAFARKVRETLDATVSRETG